jgi:hypothetical protein
MTRDEELAHPTRLAEGGAGKMGLPRIGDRAVDQERIQWECALGQGPHDSRNQELVGHLITSHCIGGANIALHMAIFGPGTRTG